MSDVYNPSNVSQPDSNGYEAVLFDFDGVLLATGNNDWKKLVRQASENALYGQRLNAAYGDFDHLETVMTDNDIEDFKALSRSYGMDTDGTWKTKKWHDALKQQEQLTNRERWFYEDVQTVPDLAETHAVGVVSNNTQAFVDYAVTDAPIADQQTAEPLGNYLDVCYGIGLEIDDMDNRKPDTEYLDQAAKDLAIPPENVLYVGDRESDIEAAHAAGMDSAFVWRDHHYENGKPKTELAIEPDHHIDGLDELADKTRIN